MQIYDTLKSDHEELKQLLTRLIDAQEGERKGLIEQVRDALVPHSRAEEAVFYNSLREYDRAKEKVNHSFKEHMEAETLLRTMQVKESVTGDWKKTATKLKDAVEHHIQEEEGEVFPLARQFLTDQEAEMMAGAFEKLKASTKEEGFIETSFDLVRNLMPPRFTEKFREFGASQKAS